MLIFHNHGFVYWVEWFPDTGKIDGATLGEFAESIEGAGEGLVSIRKLP